MALDAVGQYRLESVRNRALITLFHHLHGLIVVIILGHLDVVKFVKGLVELGCYVIVIV